MSRTGDIKVAVSGIPRGYQFPLPDGNWLREEHKKRIRSISPRIDLLEIPANQVDCPQGIEVLLAEGGNRVHYPGELDWADYQKFFTADLKWVQLCSTGFRDNITPEIHAGTVVLTNAPGIHTNPIAESVMAAMLNHTKCLDQRRIDQQNHRWGQIKCDELQDKTVLIIGLGRIGKKVARFCKSFDMRVIGTKKKIEAVENVDLVFPAGDLCSHLPQADFIVILAPHTPGTEGMLGGKELQHTKNSAYLINLGRGAIIDETSMIGAIKNGGIAGAYLDCFVQEPLPEDHILWDLPNVFIVPHDSHSSPHIGDRMVEIFCDNLKRYVDAKPLGNVCDPCKGY